MSTTSGGPTFTPFPVPTAVEDVPLVTHAGTRYRCTGCSTLVPEGVWITETIEDGMIVGLSMRIGADGAHIHACGRQGT